MVLLLAAGASLVIYHLVIAYDTRRVIKVLSVDRLCLDNGQMVCLAGLQAEEDDGSSVRYMSGLVGGHDVRVVPVGDMPERKPVRAYVYLGEVLVNGRAIRDGFAKADVRRLYPEQELFKAYEQRAKLECLGMWK